MSRRPNPVPTYRLHKPSGQAVITVRNPDSTRRDVYLGEFNSPESRAEYSRIVAELASAAAMPTSASAAVPSALTVAELLHAFWKHAQQHYRRPDGTPTSEIDNYRMAIRATRELYGHTLVRDFGPLALKAIRGKLITSGLCRKVINVRVYRIRHIFKWGMGEQLVPPEVFTALTAVSGLQKGRTEAPDRPAVGPVSEAQVAAVLPHLRPAVGAMVRVQLLTGMRPGEICRLRPADIDTSGPVWVYHPAVHKNAHRGKGRAIAIGPKAQLILMEFAPEDPAGYYFSPRRTVADLHADRSDRRVTKRWPSHLDRNRRNRVKHPRRRAGNCYPTHSYAVAVSRACDAAYPPAMRLQRGTVTTGGKKRPETEAEWFERIGAAGVVELKAWRKAHRWHPNQLRHAHATKVRERFGLEAAQVALGHEQADVTQIYAERNVALAAKVAAEIG